MSEKPNKSQDVPILPPIPAKRYFTIGEVGDLCGVKPHVLRYWEQEFVQLKPVKRRGNRRYYQHHEVLLIRRIRQLLYEEGFTIVGARNKLESGSHDATELIENTQLNESEPHSELSDLTIASQGQLWPEISSHSAGLKTEDARDFLNLLLKILA